MRDKQTRFDISNLSKMLDRIDSIQELYDNLSEEAKENLENNFDDSPADLLSRLNDVLCDYANMMSDM